MFVATLMRHGGLTLARKKVTGSTYRIIPSQFPPIRLFERSLSSEDLYAAYELESLTNDRIKAQVGHLDQVAPGDAVTGAGSTPIMASFTHIGQASRFTDGLYGVYYAGLCVNTALAETKYWQARQLSDSNEGSTSRVMRLYVGDINPDYSEFDDIREQQGLHNPTDYTDSQAYGRAARARGEFGLLYRSVRYPAGECIAAFKPKVILPVIQSAHYRYHWNGSEIFHIEKVETVDV